MSISHLKRQIAFFIPILTCSFCFSIYPLLPVSAALPEYYIELDPEHLALLNQRPVVVDVLYVDAATGDRYFPARFICNDDTIECEVRHRGSWSMFFPRRSWRLKFDDKGVLGGERININSEYKDHSGMRNLLVNSLFTYFGWPAPKTKHVNFHVNGEYMGVFSQIENVDEDFLDRIGKEPGNLYKLGDHGGAMAPLTRYYRYERTWAKKIGNPSDYSDIQMLFNKMLYWTKKDFDAGIASLVDIDNVLMYFAIMYAVNGSDSCTKNYYLYNNPETGLFEIFPWDTDDSFRGEHQDTNLSIYNHVLFQRLMENERWREVFLDMLGDVIHEGFDFLDSLVIETCDLIKNDIYRDTKREAAKEEFENDVQSIRTFLVKRREFIEKRDLFDKIRLYDYRCSNPFPDSDNTDVTFTVRSEAPQQIFLNFTDDLTFNTMGSEHSVKNLMLFDDGNHGDGEPGDLVYGNTLTVPSSFRGIIPYCFKASYKYTYPWNGLFYVQWVRSTTLAVNAKNTKSRYINSVGFGDVYRIRNDVFIELKNTSDSRVDISYCHIRGNEYYEDFILPAYTTIAAGKSIFVTTNAVLAEQAFEDIPWVDNRPLGNMCFTISEGDSIKLMSPALTVLLGTTCETVKELAIEKYSIVINEINYNSADDHDTEDWVELYNPHETDVDLSGWILKDDDDSHAFVFPDGTTIEGNGYLVISRNQEMLQYHYWWPIAMIGDLDFGLSGSGDDVRLYNRLEELVDVVGFNDKEPWPVEADGEGSTLSLVNPVLDNTEAVNWAPSSGHGTPGRKNDVYEVGIDDATPSVFSLGQNYPNPCNPVTTIPFGIPEDSHVKLIVYSVLGQRVATLIDGRMTAGMHSVQFDASGLSSGIYLYRIEADKWQKTASMLVVK